MGVLDHLFEVEVIFKTRPTLGEGACAVVVGGVCSCVSVFVLDKVEVPTHEEVGDHRDCSFERSDLLGASSKIDRAKVDVEGNKAV